MCDTKSSVFARLERFSDVLFGSDSYCEAKKHHWRVNIIEPIQRLIVVARSQMRQNSFDILHGNRCRNYEEYVGIGIKVL